MIALLDIGGTKLAAAAAPEPASTHIENVVRTATPADAAVPGLISLLDEVTRGQRPAAIAISAPGPFDRQTAVLLEPPGMATPWHGLRLGDVLGARFGCPVVVENDANCAALAEARLGAGRGARTVVYFTVSTGIGTGVIRDGHLLDTRHDTEGGHQVLWPEWVGGPACHCGGHGCLEALASGRAIERRFGVPAPALDSDEAWDDIGRWLGLGVVNVTALHDPDVVLFGGGVTAAWDRFAASLRRTIAEHLFLQPAPLVQRGSLGEERSLIGALLVAAARLGAATGA